MTDETTLKAGDTVELNDIDWDVDGGDDADGTHTPDLPLNVTLKLPAHWESGDSLADLLSDEHGFCVHEIGSVEVI